MKNFLKGLFRNSNHTIKKDTMQEDEIIIEKSSFLQDIKVDINCFSQKGDKYSFLKEINGNVKLLNKLSNERLRKLDNYYKDIIEQNNKKIAKLKKNT